MDDVPKCMKITIRAEFADGTSLEVEAVEPEKVTFETKREIAARINEYDLPNVWLQPVHSVHIRPGGQPVNYSGDALERDHG